MSFPVRINKYFTDQGYCSRRQADRYIEEGRVTINGRKAKLGDQVQEGDKVELDGKSMAFNPKRVYIMYNKPKGITSTTDRTIRGNIIDAIRHPLRIFHIGRLDKDSTGLILLTNHGDIVNKILRAQFGHEKEYVVQLMGPFPPDFLKKMASGVDIGDHVTKPARVEPVNASTFKIILTEGKFRQIRRMCEALGQKVRNLHRTRIMNIELGDLPEGQWKDLPEKQLQELLTTLDEATYTELPEYKAPSHLQDDSQ